MKGNFLIKTNRPRIGVNIYADKSAVVLDWLLTKGIARKGFSIREVCKERKVSIGLVQKVFSQLVSSGILDFEGVRTAKRLFLKNPKLLLENWVNNYRILNKCKVWNYQSGFATKEDLIKALKKSKLQNKISLALHSSAQALKCKNTNLDTLELYLLDKTVKSQIEDALFVEPQENGYQVLLIEPYYKTLLELDQNTNKTIKISPPLLTFLDLYHFPLRGIEQAEAI